MSRTTSMIARPSADVLRRLYVDEQLGCPDIGRMYERDPKTVLWWLRQAGIPTRPRGSDPRQWFRTGEPGAHAGHKHTREARRKISAASRDRGAVPYLRAGKHWLKDAPPEMNPRWLGGATPERQEFYRSEDWKRACVAVWKRANACCERCFRDFRTVNRRLEQAFHVHHIVSFQVRELRADVPNLALLCSSCHRWVHSKKNVDRDFLGDAPEVPA